MLVESPTLEGVAVFLKFLRNKNELNTKPCTVKQGRADFQEKIEMKSFFEQDKATGTYKAKLSELQALTKSGQLLGAVSINLSDYAKPNNYKQKLQLKPAVGTVGPSSYIEVEIETQDSNTPSGGKGKDG